VWSPRLSFPEVGFLVGTVHIKFFEGTRENTDDLEDEKTRRQLGSSGERENKAGDSRG